MAAGFLSRGIGSNWQGEFENLTIDSAELRFGNLKIGRGERKKVRKYRDEKRSHK